MDAIKGWRTILFNSILVVTGLAEASGFVLPESFADDVNGMVLAVVGVIGVVLRVVTTGPIGNK